MKNRCASLDSWSPVVVISGWGGVNRGMRRSIGQSGICPGPVLSPQLFVTIHLGLGRTWG